MTGYRTDCVPFKLGRQAKPGTVNPYPFGSRDADSWQAGRDGAPKPVAADPKPKKSHPPTYTGEQCRWTDAELIILRQNYASALPAELVKLLPNRTPQAIAGMATRIGVVKVEVVQPWTQEDIGDLKRYVNLKLRVDQIAVLLGRSESSVANKGNRLGLFFAGQGVPRGKPAPTTDQSHNQGVRHGT
jgi:hypothetical protein